MKIHLKNLVAISKTAFKKWWKKDPFRDSAVIAYYSIFALPGLLVVIISLSGYFFGRDAVNSHLAGQITQMFGADTSVQIQEMVIKASTMKNTFLATLLGIITIFIGATGVFVEFQKSLNLVWEVKAYESDSGLWDIIRVRLFSFGLILSFAFILIVSLVISATMAALGTWLSGYFSDSFVVLLLSVNFVLSFLILAVLFALMFKVLPDAKIQWKHVFIGSMVTAFLFEIGKFFLSFYFGKANPGTGYGPAGSVILILIWVSYSSMIVFYGAEFTHAFANKYSGKIAPKPNAMPIEPEVPRL
ncbi:MAG: YihY/virulence factor BrkB family protein [Bacteroidetes bacterium]|nr:YihY/virulence factor BrkB family protein [Bacteroidota bacterium]